MIEQQRNELGGHRGFGVIKAEVDLIVDEPTEEFQTPYTVLMPRRIDEVRNHRQFTKGRCVVYDPEIARDFQQSYGYAVEPDLPEPKKREKSKQRRYLRT